MVACSFFLIALFSQELLKMESSLAVERTVDAPVTVNYCQPWNGVQVVAKVRSTNQYVYMHSLIRLKP